MPPALVDDALWARIEPLLPKRRRRNRQYAGRKPIPDRAVLIHILRSAAMDAETRRALASVAPDILVLGVHRPPRNKGGKGLERFARRERIEGLARNLFLLHDVLYVHDRTLS